MTTNNDILDENYLSVQEVAKFRGVSRQRVYKWIEAGLACDHDRLGRCMVRRDDAAAWEPMDKSPGRPLTVTLRQIAKAKKMRRSGKTLSEIAVKIGVSKQVVFYHVGKNGGNEP